MTYFRSLTMDASGKVARIVVVGDTTATSVGLWAQDTYSPRLLGRHPVGGAFDAPIEVQAGQPLWIEAAEMSTSVHLDPLRDEAWRARAEAQRERKRAELQADALDAALWRAGDLSASRGDAQIGMR